MKYAYLASQVLKLPVILSPSLYGWVTTPFSNCDLLSGIAVSLNMLIESHSKEVIYIYSKWQQGHLDLKDCLNSHNKFFFFYIFFFFFLLLHSTHYK